MNRTVILSGIGTARPAGSIEQDDAAILAQTYALRHSILLAPYRSSTAEAACSVEGACCWSQPEPS